MCRGKKKKSPGGRAVGAMTGLGGRGGDNRLRGGGRTIAAGPKGQTEEDLRRVAGAEKEGT